MADISELASEIRELRHRIYNEVNKGTQKVAAVILETAAANTPVDTTQALSNWQVGLDSAPSSFIDAKVPGKEGSTLSASLEITIREGKAVLKTRQMLSITSPARGKTKPFPDIHIVNNAPYIDELNDGTISKQPDAFVQKAIMAGERQQNSTRLDLRHGL